MGSHPLLPPSASGATARGGLRSASAEGTLEMNLFFVSQPGLVAWSSARFPLQELLEYARMCVHVVSSHIGSFLWSGGDAPPRLLPLVLPCAVKHEAALSLSSMLCERLSGSWHTSVSQIAAAGLGHDCVSDLWLGIPVPKALLAVTANTVSSPSGNISGVS